MRKFYQVKSELYRGRATPLTSPQRVQHPYGGTAQRLPPPPGFRPLPGQRQRKEEGGPFDKHPEVSARLAHAGAERSECHRPARAGRRLPCSSRKRFRTTPVHKQTCALGAGSAPSVLFFWTGRGPFSFRQDRKENGGRIAAVNTAESSLNPGILSCCPTHAGPPPAPSGSYSSLFGPPRSAPRSFPDPCASPGTSIAKPAPPRNKRSVERAERERPHGMLHERMQNHLGFCKILPLLLLLL